MRLGFHTVSGALRRGAARHGAALLQANALHCTAAPRRIGSGVNGPSSRWRWRLLTGAPCVWWCYRNPGACAGGRVLNQIHGGREQVLPAVQSVSAGWRWRGKSLSVQGIISRGAHARITSQGCSWRRRLLRVNAMVDAQVKRSNCTAWFHLLYDKSTDNSSSGGSRNWCMVEGWSLLSLPLLSLAWHFFLYFLAKSSPLNPARESGERCKPPPHGPTGGIQ